MSHCAVVGGIPMDASLIGATMSISPPLDDHPEEGGPQVQPHCSSLQDADLLLQHPLQYQAPSWWDLDSGGQLSLHVRPRPGDRPQWNNNLKSILTSPKLASGSRGEKKKKHKAHCQEGALGWDRSGGTVSVVFCLLRSNNNYCTLIQPDRW